MRRNRSRPSRPRSGSPSHPGDPVAITYPYDTDFIVSPMVWQAEDAFGFRLLGDTPDHPGATGAARWSRR